MSKALLKTTMLFLQYRKERTLSTGVFILKVVDSGGSFCYADKFYLFHYKSSITASLSSFDQFHVLWGISNTDSQLIRRMSRLVPQFFSRLIAKIF